MCGERTCVTRVTTAVRAEGAGDIDGAAKERADLSGRDSARGAGDGRGVSGEDGTMTMSPSPLMFGSPFPLGTDTALEAEVGSDAAEEEVLTVTFGLTFFVVVGLLVDADADADDAAEADARASTRAARAPRLCWPLRDSFGYSHTSPLRVHWLSCTDHRQHRSIAPRPYAYTEER